jgi:hypothetical protein
MFAVSTIKAISKLYGLRDTLIMEAASTSEQLINFNQTTQHHTSEVDHHYFLDNYI